MAKSSGDHRVYRTSRKIHKSGRNQSLNIGTNRKTQIIDKRKSATLKKLRSKRRKNEQFVNKNSEVSGTEETCKDKKLVNDVSEVLGTKKIRNDRKLANNVFVVPVAKNTHKDNVLDGTEVPDKKEIQVNKKPSNVVASKKLRKDTKFVNYISAVPSTKKTGKDKERVNDISKVSRASKKDKDKTLIKNPLKVLRFREKDNNEKICNNSSKVPNARIKYTDTALIDNTSMASRADEPNNSKNNGNNSIKEKINGKVNKDTTMVLRSRDPSAKLIHDSSKVPIKEIRKSKRLFDISSELLKSKKKHIAAEFIDDLSGNSSATEPFDSENNLDDAFTEKTNDDTVNENSPMVLRSRDTSAKLIDELSKKPCSKKIRKNNKLFINSTGARLIDDKLKIIRTDKPCDTENCINGASKKKNNDANVDEDIERSLCFKDVCAKLINDLSKIRRTERIRKNVKVVDNLSKVSGSKKKCTHAELIGDKSKLSDSNEPRNTENNVNDASDEKTNDGRLIENLPIVRSSADKRSDPKIIDHSTKMPALAVASTLKKLSSDKNCSNRIIWRCEICYLEFKTKYNLHRHTKRYANPPFPYGGTESPDTKRQHSPIKYNKINLERDVVSFKCPICNQPFNGKNPLQAHMCHYHDGGFATLQQKSASRLPISATSKKSGVEVNRKSLKNTKKSCTRISKQPILPKHVEAARHCLESCETKEKIGENEIATTDDAKVFEISKKTISEVEVENKNDEASLGHEKKKFAILNNVNNTEPSKHGENTLVESEIRIGDEDQEIMDNPADKYETRSSELGVSVVKENYIAEESFEVSQNREEIEKTDSIQLVEEARLDILDCEKKDEQRKLTNPSDICEESEIIDKNGIFNDTSINVTEKHDMTEELFEMSQNCEGTDNADKHGVLKDASDNIVEGKNMTGKPFEISLNSEQIEKTFDVINVPEQKEEMKKSLEILKSREVIEKAASTGLIEDESLNRSDDTFHQEKPPEILQECEEIENSDKDIIFNETSINVMEEKGEVGKPFKIFQNFETTEKTAGNHIIDDARLNEPDEMSEQDKSFGISLNVEDLKNTDKNGIFNETIVKVPHEKDVGGESFEISQNCRKIENSPNTRLVKNVNMNESEKSNERNKFLGVSQNYKTNLSIDKNGVFQNSSDSEAENTDYDTSLEIPHNFEETEQIDEPRVITYTNFNLLRKMHGTIEIPNILENFEKCNYRSFVSDVKSIDSMEGSESDQSDIAEALDDNLHDAYEKPDDPVNEANLHLLLSMNTLVHELEVLLLKIKISDEEKKSSKILKGVDKSNKSNFLTNNVKNNEAYHFTHPNRNNLVKSHNDSLRETLKNDSDQITFEKRNAVNRKSNETSKNTENDNMKSDSEVHIFNRMSTAGVSDKIEATSSDTIINIPAVELASPKMLENSKNYEKIDLADNTISLNSHERSYGKDIAAEKTQDGENIENKNSNDFSNEDSSSLYSEESILNEFADAINDILKESLESDEQSSLHKIERFQNDDVLRAQYSCKHCYVSVRRLNINDLKAINSKKSTAEINNERPTEGTECQANSSFVVLPCSMCPEMFSTEALRRKHIDNVHCSVSQRYDNQITPAGPPSRRRCRTRHFADCDDKETCECDKDLIGRRTSNDRRRVKNRAVKSFPKITNTSDMAKMPYRSWDKCERCPHCGETFWLPSFLQLHLLQCKKCPSVKMPHQRAIKRFRMEFGRGPMHPGERECRICNALFQNSGRLLQHEQLYARAKIHRCSVCGTGFPDVNLLYDHTATAHVSGAYVSYCTLCHQGFTGELQRNVHTMHIHDGKVMIDRTIGVSPPVLHLEKISDDVSIRKCDVCQLGFINRKRFIEHAIYYKRDASIRCNLCNAEFDGQYSAHSHNKMLHYSTEMRNAYPHSCTICREGFIYKRHLQAHVYHVHRKPFEPFGSLDVQRVTGLASIAKTSSQTSSPNGLGNIYTCNICEMSFFTADLLASHCIEYSKGGRFSCTRCDKKCRMASLLLDHVSLNHSALINECVRCLSCNENLLNPSDGMSHVKHFHSNDAREPSEFYVETNIASVKNFGINQSDLIPKNRAIYDGSAYKKIEMEIDRDWTSRAASLIDAAKVENREKIEKKASEHQTEKQKKMGKASSDQEIEKLVDEKKWSCAICSVNFRGSAELAKHAALWSNEGSYTCEVCGRRFKLIRFYQEHRMKHFRSHSKEDRYCCASCNEGFETMQLMTMHKAHVHGKEIHKLSSEALGVLKFASSSNQNRQSVPPREKISASATRSVGVSTNQEYNTMPNALHLGYRITADSPNLPEKESHRQKKHSIDDVPYDRVTLDSDAVITIDDSTESTTLPSIAAVKRTNVEVITISDESPSANPAKDLALKNFSIHPASSARLNLLTGMLNTQLASNLNLHFVEDTSAVPGASKGTYVPFDATVVREDLKKRTIALNDSNACSLALNATNVCPVTLNGTNAHKITVNSANLRLMAIDATDAHAIMLNGANVRLIALNTPNTHPVPSNSTNASPVLSNNTNATKARPAVSTATNVRPVVSAATNVHPVPSNLSAIRQKALTIRNGRETASNTTNATSVAPTATVIHSVPRKTSIRHAAVPTDTVRHPVALSAAVRHLIPSNAVLKHPIVSTAIVRNPITPNCIIRRSVTSDIPNADSVVSNVKNAYPVTTDATISRSVTPTTLNTRGLAPKVTNACPVTPNVATARSLSSPPTRNIFVTVLETPDGTNVVQKNSCDILRCKSCNIMFTNVDQLKSHKVSVHGLETTDIQIIGDIMLRRDNGSVTLLKKSVEELQLLVSPLPATSNRPIDRIHVTKHHAHFDFQAVNASINPAKCYQVVNETFDSTQKSTIIPSPVLAVVDDAPECTIPIDKASSHHAPANNNVRNNTRFSNQPRQQDVTKRKSKPTKIVQPEKKRSRESSYDPKVFEELCRQHSLTARSTIKKNEVPVITFL